MIPEFGRLYYDRAGEVYCVYIEADTDIRFGYIAFDEYVYYSGSSRFWPEYESIVEDLSTVPENILERYLSPFLKLDYYKQMG